MLCLALLRHVTLLAGWNVHSSFIVQIGFYNCKAPTD